MRKLVFLGIVLVVAVSLSGCVDYSAKTNHQEMDMNHAGKHEDHSGSGQLPAGMKTATNPAFPVGSVVILKDDHMPGMKGAQATIVGAYDTTVYSVTYMPTNGGPQVTNHKWVVHEELKNAENKLFSIGDTVTLTADHMKGMNGAEATIDRVYRTTVYVVDFVPTTGGEMVKNHMWMTEDELDTE